MGYSGLTFLSFDISNRKHSMKILNLAGIQTKDLCKHNQLLRQLFHNYCLLD